MYDYIYTNNKDYGGNFKKEFNIQLNKAKHVVIASGYFGADTLEYFNKSIVKQAKRGSCKILIGMVFHSGVTAKQKKQLVYLDRKLREASDDSGIFISMRPYHGKVYKFEGDNETNIYLGSSNFSNEGFASRYECNALVRDKQVVLDLSNYLDNLFSLDSTICLNN